MFRTCSLIVLGLIAFSTINSTHLIAGGSGQSLVVEKDIPIKSEALWVRHDGDLDKISWMAIGPKGSYYERHDVKCSNAGAPAPAPCQFQIKLNRARSQFVVVVQGVTFRDYVSSSEVSVGYIAPDTTEHVIDTKKLYKHQQGRVTSFRLGLKGIR